MGRPIALLLSCSLLAACANHVRDSDTESEREHRVTLATRYTLEAPGGLLERTQLRMAFFKQETFESRVERTAARFEERTPYEGVRELYEVPAGLVSVPLSFVFNALDMALLGYIPNELVNGYTSWTFAALNPLLNAESQARTERRQIHSESREWKRGQQSVRSAMADAPVAAALDGDREAQLVTDADGVLKLDLLQLMATFTASGPPRKLSVVVRDGAGAEQLRQGFFLERDLALRLAGAVPLARIAANPKASPDALAQAIFALDRLGFREESAQLQETARERLASEPNALGMMLRGIDTLYATRPAVDALLQALWARGEEAPVPAAPALRD